MLGWLAARMALLHRPGGRCLLDVDDTVIEVHGRTKQGAGPGYSGLRGPTAVPRTATTTDGMPVIVAQRLRKARPAPSVLARRPSGRARHQAQQAGATAARVSVTVADHR